MRQRLGGIVLVPKPVNKLIRPAHLGGQIDVILVGGCVAPRVDARELRKSGIHPRPPGIPRANSRLDPGNITQLVRRGQSGNEIGFDQIPGLPANHQNTPWADARHGRGDEPVSVLACG